jgi:Ankyrin repeat
LHTILSYAIGAKKPLAVIKFLIDHGADVNTSLICDKIVTPLMVARAVRYDEAIPLLLQAGAQDAPLETRPLRDLSCIIPRGITRLFYYLTNLFG